ncbi:MAG: ATP-binding protein [Vulcanimicrobiaceae bacterium]
MSKRQTMGSPGSDKTVVYALPTGTVTFLFSDIEGSTQRWEAYRAAMTVAVERHDTLMRSAIEAHNGYIFKTIGDAFCAAFSSSPDALAAALDAQRALAAEDFSTVAGLRVRMALDTGSADERDRDYFGPIVNRVARLLAAAHGGQIVLSAATTELVKNAMPPTVTLRDLGEHRLKDLAQPERISQVVAPDLPAEFPPLLSLDSAKNNLPLQRTSLVGRDGEVEEIKSHLASSRLVTLTGAGGVGKTRVALQAGAELYGSFTDGVWFVDLAPHSDPALVASEIGRIFDLQESLNRSMVDAVASYLAKKKLLLILDNCEHLIDEVALCADAILRTCPSVKILATSREPLNISGEDVHAVPSLAVPPAEASITARQASRFGAVQLFVDRAIAADHAFAFTDDNAGIVVDIVRRLDGIALAIELAAARTKVLSVRTIDEKLDERFRLLTGGDRTALPRHKTMRALIDWSYDHLCEKDRALLRRLSIFAGGFSLPAVATVCADEWIQGNEILDLLSSLVEKSLVQMERLGDEARYNFLESTRQYAREKLVESGEYETIANAHAGVMLELAESLRSAYHVTPGNRRLEESVVELDNWRAALAWAFRDSTDALIGQRLAASLMPVWLRFAAAEGMRWVRQGLARAGPGTPAGVAAQLNLVEAGLATVLHLYRAALAPAERALALSEQIGDVNTRAEAQQTVGRALTLLGQVDEGEVLLREALGTFRELDNRLQVCLTLINLAAGRGVGGDAAGARLLYREALVLGKTLGAERMTAVAALNLAETELAAGDIEAAVRSGNDAAFAAGKIGAKDIRANASCNLAGYLLLLQRWDEARERARDALLWARELQNNVIVSWAMQHLAAVAALRVPDAENLARAARLVGYVDASVAAYDAPRDYNEQQEYQSVVAALGEGLSANELPMLFAEGRAWTEDRAVEEAMNI